MMSPRQVIVLAVAALSAGGALFLVQRSGQASVRTEVEKPLPAGPSVLVAARDLRAGAVATPEDLQWAPWPEGALNPLFVQQRAKPKAIEQMSGWVARFDMVKGEPIVEGRLVQRGDKGYFAALVAPGYRAAAIEVSPETASAGFIQPNDRVDVVLTRSIEAEGGRTRSGVILSNVRVLSMGSFARTQPPDEGGPEPIRASVATLELSPRDAETLAIAQRLGSVSLLLRGIELEPGTQPGPGRHPLPSAGPPLEASVRVHRFGATSDVTVPRAAP